jgi:hypothetical protein
MSKSIFTSKSVWVGVITLAIGVANLFAGSDLIATYPQIVAGCVSISGALAIVLRLVTTKPIK